MTRPPSTLAILDLAILLAGMLCITMGVALYSRPAAFIVGGVQLIAVALWPSPTPRRSE